MNYEELKNLFKNPETRQQIIQCLKEYEATDSIKNVTDLKIRINLFETMRKWNRKVEVLQADVQTQDRFTPSEKVYLIEKLVEQKELYWNIASYLTNL